MKKVLGLGNVLVDALYQVTAYELQVIGLPKGTMQLIDQAHYQALTQHMEGREGKLATGGSACNTILALSHLGVPVGLVGKAGSDRFGRFFADNCLRHGISARLLPSELPTGVASTFVIPGGERTFATYLGAAADMRPEEVRPEWFEGYDYLYVEGYLVQNHELILQAVRQARAQGLQVCLDLASPNIVEQERDFFAELLPLVDIVFANEQEALAMTGQEHPQQAVEVLAQTCPVAVVKAGGGGAYCRVPDGYAWGAAHRLDEEQVVDTTGAGDFFAAGFLYNLCRGGEPLQGLRPGATVAAAVIQQLGTELDEQVWKQVRARI